MALVLSCGQVYGQGIDFREISLETALAEAGKDGKYVFVDCYTSWCGPCKRMDREVFPLEKVGTYFNSAFICVKYDMDREECKEIKDKYDVHSFPTYLLLRPDGTVQHKVVGGGRNADEFIEVFKQGVTQNNSLSYLEGLYLKGGMDKDGLLRYGLALREARDRDGADRVLEELKVCLTDEEKTQAEYWVLFRDKKFGEEEYLFVVANLDAFQKNVGKEIVDSFIMKNYEKLIKYRMSALGFKWDFSKSLADLSAIRDELDRVDIAGKEKIAEHIGLLTAYMNGDTKGAMESVGKMVSAGGEDLQAVYTFFKAIRRREDTAMIKEVVQAKDHLLRQAAGESREELAEAIANLEKSI